MNIGAYTGASALAAYEKWQSAISQNIAFGSIPGFKKTEIAFDSMVGDTTKLNQRGGMASDVQGSMPMATTRINFTQGALEHTGNDLDFAIQCEGLFQVQRSDGKQEYTRDGSFHKSPEGKLVTRQGYAVMGDGGPIAFEDGGAPVSINTKGELFQGDKQIGALRVYKFSDPQKLMRAKDGLFVPSDPSVQPQPVENATIVNNSLEGSNVSPLTEMVNLINVSHAYQASQKIITSADDDTDKAIQTLGNPPS